MPSPYFDFAVSTHGGSVSNLSVNPFASSKRFFAKTEEVFDFRSRSDSSAPHSFFLFLRFHNFFAFPHLSGGFGLLSFGMRFALSRCICSHRFVLQGVGFPLHNASIRYFAELLRHFSLGYTYLFFFGSSRYCGTERTTSWATR